MPTMMPDLVVSELTGLGGAKPNERQVLDHHDSASGILPSLRRLTHFVCRATGIAG